MRYRRLTLVLLLLPLTGACTITSTGDELPTAEQLADSEFSDPWSWGPNNPRSNVIHER
jgi:hypothetical protein